MNDQLEFSVVGHYFQPLNAWFAEVVEIAPDGRDGGQLFASRFYCDLADAAKECWAWVRDNERSTP
jgi:hypothetical protein